MAPDVAPETGLTSAEVSQRTTDGQVNRSVDPIRRSFTKILRANALTRVNAIMLALFGLVLISGHWQDGLFVGVVLSNTVVGVGQEVKARRELEKLQVLTEPKAEVVRDGERQTIDADAVVLDEMLMLSPGGQVPVDGSVISATGLRVDESMLTGESEPVIKVLDDKVLSGSFVVADQEGSGQLPSVPTAMPAR